MKKTLNKFLITFFLINLIVITIFYSLNFKFNTDTIMLHIISKEYFISKIFFSADNFLIKIPIYYISVVLFGFSKKSLFMTTFFFLNLTVLLFGIFYYKQMNKKNIKIYEFFSLLYLINIGFFYTLLIDSHRNFEIPLLFLIIFRNKIINKTITYFLILLLSIIFFSDPYYIYVIAVPFLFSAGLLYYLKKLHTNDRKKLIIIIFSVILSYLIRFIFNKSGFFFIYNENENANFVSFQQFFINILSFIEVILNLFNANFFGNKIFQIDGIFSILNLFFLLLILYGSKISFEKGIKKNNIFQLFVSQSFFITIFVYVLSVVVSINNSRYLILIFFLSTFLLKSTIFEIKKKNQTTAKIIIFLGILTSIFNFSKIYDQYFYNRTIDDEYRQNFFLINNLIENKLSYGFSGYWNSGINTFLSNEKVKIMQIICKNGKIFPNTWNMSIRMYDNNHTGNTFLIYPIENFLIEEDIDKDIKFFDGCGEPEILTQFGIPEKILNLSFDNKLWKIYIFNYNIFSKMSQDFEPYNNLTKEIQKF